MSTAFQIFTQPSQQALDTAANVLSGATLTFTLTGTSTPTNAYSDSTLSTPVSNPLSANAAGVFIPVFLDPTIIYRVVLKTQAGAVLQTWDPANEQVLSAALIGFYLYPRTLAEIAALVTPVSLASSPDHIGADVRRYGTIDLAGATDCRAILNTANSVGVSLYFPKGTYRVASNLTLSVACFFDQGAVLKPDASVVITFTNSIVAGPWKIFDVSNTPSTGASSLQNGVTPIVGPAQISQVYAEWFGATGGNTGFNDGAPIQGALNFCMSCFGVPLQLLAKIYYTTQQIYFGGSAAAKSLMCVSIYGVPAAFPSQTTLTDNSTFGSPTPLLTARCTSANNVHAEVRDIFFTGSAANTIGIQFAGACYARAVRCRFNTLLEGIRWCNLDAGTFTEFCIADACEFGSACVLKGRYLVASGNTSFHGSGFWNRCGLQHSGATPVIQIDNGAQPYNAALDCQVWTTVSCAIIHNLDASAGTVSFIGNLTVERGGGTITLADSNAVLFAGFLASNNQNVVAGTLLQCRAVILNSSGSSAPLGAEQASSQALTTGANTLVEPLLLYAQPRRMFLTVAAANYLYVYDLIVYPTGSGSTTVQGPAGGAPVAIIANNTAGYGAPAIGATAGGQITVTQAGFPASGVTAQWDSRACWAGVSGGATGSV